MTTGDQVRRVAERLQQFTAELMPEWPLVGGAVALVSREGTLASYGFGHADAERGLPASPGDLFQIGSISKTFVSVVVNQLVDEGVLRLDEPITETLPWVDLGRDTDDVTLRRLLSHTSGLILGGDGVPDDLAQLWALRHLTRSTAAQEHFHYSNVGYMLLGQAVRARTGQSLAATLQQRVFEPLGMTQSLGRMRQTDRARMATGYWPKRDDIPWAPGDPLVPAAWFDIDAADGNVASCAADMAAFARLLLSDGSVDGTRVLRPSTLERILTPAAPGGEDVLAVARTGSVTSSRYGMGVNVERIGDATCYTHGGGMVGFQSFLLADRTRGLGVIVLTNANGCYPVAQVIARVAHHLLATGGSGDLPDPRTGVGPQVDLHERLLGTFAAGDEPDTAVVEIARDAAGLLLTSHGVSAPMTRTWTGRYVSPHPAWRAYRWDAAQDAAGVRWTHGPDVFRPVGSGPEVVDASPGPTYEATHPLVGRYRNYSPWFPTLSIFAREGKLYLSAPGGVEAPAEDCELVELQPGGPWRLGSEPWLPERLSCGPVIDGRAIAIVRDGVEYSRLEE